jgi:methionine salvage enolase-phosphatase E1
VSELKRTIESIDRIVERLVQHGQADKHKNAGDKDEDDEDDEESNVEQIEKLIESQLELRRNLKMFQVEMMRIELQRAEIEAELFEQSVDTMHKVKVLELIHR